MAERRNSYLAIGGLMIAVGVVLAFVVDLSELADVREGIVVAGAFLVGLGYILAGVVPERTVGPSPLDPELFVGLALIVAGVATAAGISWILSMQADFGPNETVALVVGAICAIPLLGGGIIHLVRSARPPDRERGDAAT